MGTDTLIMKIHLIILFFLFNASLFSQIKIEKIATLPEIMHETSGLVYYKKEFLLTHNDGGNDPEIFVLDTLGNHLKTIKINNAKNKDWEEITVDNHDNLYIGDFGNNNNKREKLFIYILKNGFIEKDFVEPKIIEFIYEDQHEFPPKSETEFYYDCEAFFWKDDELFLFTKNRTLPFDGIVKIYSLPAKQGKYKAKLIGKIKLCTAGWQFCSITGMSYHKKSNTIALLTYSRLFLLKNFTENNFWEGELISYQIPLIKQREAISFYKKNTLFMTDEYKRGFGGGNLYKIYLKK